MPPPATTRSRSPTGSRPRGRPRRRGDLARRSARARGHPVQRIGAVRAGGVVGADRLLDPADQVPGPVDDDGGSGDRAAYVPGAGQPAQPIHQPSVQGGPVGRVPVGVGPDADGGHRRSRRPRRRGGRGDAVLEGEHTGHERDTEDDREHGQGQPRALRGEGAKGVLEHGRRPESGRFFRDRHRSGRTTLARARVRPIRPSEGRRRRRSGQARSDRTGRSTKGAPGSGGRAAGPTGPSTR